MTNVVLVMVFVISMREIPLQCMEKEIGLKSRDTLPTIYQRSSFPASSKSIRCPVTFIFMPEHDPRRDSARTLINATSHPRHLPGP